jgi:uncharacterized protein (DUF1697 family)
MPRYIAFLRAINVGGHIVKMEQLRALFVSLGLANVETFIASGNVIFDTDAADTNALQQQIEAHLQAALGYEVATFLRTDAEVAAIASYQPFGAAMMEAAGALNIAFLAEPLSAAAVQTLRGWQTEVDSFHTHDREVYWHCRVKQSESKFSNAIFERKLKVKATFRGLNTVVRLAAKYSP